MDRLLILGAVLILVMLGAMAYQYYQGQRERDVINILKQEGVWYTQTNYEKFVDADVDSLSKPSGQWTYKTATVNYTLQYNPTSPQYNRLQITYILNSTEDCSHYSGCSYNQDVLLVATNNVTALGQGTGNPYFDYWGPTNYLNVPYYRSLDLNTPTGQHIAWHIYLYLVTYTSGGPRWEYISRNVLKQLP
jgi:hypothetical protein